MVGMAADQQAPLVRAARGVAGTEAEDRQMLSQMLSPERLIQAAVVEVGVLAQARPARAAQASSS